MKEHQQREVVRTLKGELTMVEMVSEALKTLPKTFEAMNVMAKISEAYGSKAVANGLCEVAAACNQLVEAGELTIDKISAPFQYQKTS